MGFLKRIIHNPVIQHLNPIAGIKTIIEHPKELIRNPISTIAHITPITAIAHDAVKSLPLATVIQKMREEAPLVGTALHRIENITKEIIQKPVDLGKVIVNTGEKVITKTEKAIMKIESKAESVIGSTVHGIGGVVGSVGKGVGGLFGDIKWIILGVAGIAAVVVVMKGKELLNEFKKK